MRLGNKIKCLELGKVLGTLDDLLLDLEDVEADGLGERAALTNGDRVTLLDTNEGRGHVGGQVLFCVEILRSPQSVSCSLMPLFVLDTREIIELGQRTNKSSVQLLLQKRVRLLTLSQTPLISRLDFKNTTKSLRSSPCGASRNGCTWR